MNEHAKDEALSPLKALWNPTSTPPSNDREVIGWDGHRMRVVWYERHSQGGDWYWRDQGRDYNWTGKDLTHWHDLALPPKIK